MTGKPPSRSRSPILSVTVPLEQSVSMTKVLNGVDTPLDDTQPSVYEAVILLKGRLGRTWSERYCILNAQSYMLVYRKLGSNGSPLLTFKIQSGALCTITEGRKDTFAIHVVNAQNAPIDKFEFNVKTLEVAKQWQTHLLQAAERETAKRLAGERLSLRDVGTAPAAIRDVLKRAEINSRRAVEQMMTLARGHSRHTSETSDKLQQGIEDGLLIDAMNLFHWRTVKVDNGLRVQADNDPVLTVDEIIRRRRVLWRQLYLLLAICVAWVCAVWSDVVPLLHATLLAVATVGLSVYHFVSCFEDMPGHPSVQVAEVVAADPESIFALIHDTTRWLRIDPSMIGYEVIEKIDEHTETGVLGLDTCTCTGHAHAHVHAQAHEWAMLKWFGIDTAGVIHIIHAPLWKGWFWMLPRDLCLTRYWRREDNGGYIIIMQPFSPVDLSVYINKNVILPSLTHSTVSSPTPSHRGLCSLSYHLLQSTSHHKCPPSPNFVRAVIPGASLMIMPSLDNTTARPTSIVQQTCTMDPGGYSQYFRWFEEDYTFVLPIMRSLLCLRDAFSWTNFDHVAIYNGEEKEPTKHQQTVSVDHQGYVMGVNKLSTNAPTHMYHEPHASKFKVHAAQETKGNYVRGPIYLMDGKKVTAQPSAFNLVGMDVFAFEDPSQRYNLASRPDNTIYKLNQQDPNCPFTFVVTFVVPCAENLSVACYYQPTDSDWREKRSTFCDVLSDFMDGDDNYRNQRFKLIPSVEKGSYILRKMVAGKPAIVGNKGLKNPYFHGDNWFEVDVDVNSDAHAREITSMAVGVTKSLVVDIAFLIESKTAEELPETIIGTVQFDRIALKSIAVPIAKNTPTTATATATGDPTTPHTHTPTKATPDNNTTHTHNNTTQTDNTTHSGNVSTHTSASRCVSASPSLGTRNGTGDSVQSLVPMKSALQSQSMGRPRKARQLVRIHSHSTDSVTGSRQQTSPQPQPHMRNRFLRRQNTTPTPAAHTTATAKTR
ncbi:hypothetical protein SARC_01081 [Sphaeroforma arctica JP610]|uniref:PH domain-containing protein n=1 Tax=Sphaeroforma arctica JP610 TaxID=667725 RepID=A0A0L0GET8_9EUKA|nr:hypothetical protein SARC_01081 [Sphaeroforma arctica JP610]KNC86788.1 hypothetical protein SARC_01081 [Sphaeroforma arctica JP610]|eukprot:XP_014160690.1 hypothetical protein SARC_01081 [Sphaeroforma arctica JP610]